VLDAHDVFENDTYAVVPDELGVVETVSVLPPAEYPVPLTSLVVV